MGEIEERLSMVDKPNFFVDPRVVDQLLPLALVGNYEIIEEAFQALSTTAAVKEALFRRLQFILTGDTNPIEV